MTAERAPIRALRIDLHAPVASFRDPRVPGMAYGLPLPPPSTIRGLLAAADGAPADEPIAFAMASHSAGGGTDAETYHPVHADGTHPARRGRVPEGKGGATLHERPFLTGVDLTVWIPAPHAERFHTALRRPTWPLRLGRSQDLVFVKDLRYVTLEPCEQAHVGHALAPADGHDAADAETLHLTGHISGDRRDSDYHSYLWCRNPAAGQQPVRGAYRDGDQAVWLLTPATAPLPEHELEQVLAKSARATPDRRTETLTEHSRHVAQAAGTVAARIGPAGILADHPDFWTWVFVAALLHDAGKVADGFQRQLRPGGPLWGHRHEVLSLAYVQLLTRGLPQRARDMIAAGVAFHHRPLTSETPGRALTDRYPQDFPWQKTFGHDPDGLPGHRNQVTLGRHRSLLNWYASQLRQPEPEPDAADRKLWEITKDAFAAVQAAWTGPVDPDLGLLAVLVQGAVTLADHSGSAHVALQDHMPLPTDFLARQRRTPHPHQSISADTPGHLVLIAPTGSGKTEAGLAWAARQLDEMPGRPRLIWTLPYRASIDAAATRLTAGLDPPPGAKAPDIGILHGTVAQTLLAQAVEDDCAPTRQDAAKARARAAAMRLFTQRVRVATPHQLVRGAVAGPRNSSMLLEQANALIVLDELHAYDPATFGRICAAIQLWDRLGSRIAILSATLAPPMVELLQDTLGHRVTVHRAPPGTAPERHRLVLDDADITDPAAIEHFKNWLTDGHSVLIIANTVDTARHLFHELKDTARRASPGDQHAALLLHSRFRRKDRTRIERAALVRHPERQPGETRRRGGLLVSTQCVEVSLCLDFDRGAAQIAPIEATAQRLGRVNRLGHHPDGSVEFRLYTAIPPFPYDHHALHAALAALTASDGSIISEETIEGWLRTAYDTEWGRAWAKSARAARDGFAAAFLTFTEPFEDRSQYDRGLGEHFDTVDVIHSDDLDEYRRQLTDSESDPLLASELLIPIRHGQYRQLCQRGEATVDAKLRIAAVHRPYSTVTGLDLSALWSAAPPPSSAEDAHVTSPTGILATPDLGGCTTGRSVQN